MIISWSRACYRASPGLSEMSQVNQAIVVLIARGHTHEGAGCQLEQGHAIGAITFPGSD
jgi:hypothetical protein